MKSYEHDVLATDRTGKRSPDDGASTVMRPLGAHERLLHLYSRQHPRHFCVAAELAGQIETADFRAAFDAVQRRHPLLRIRIVDNAESGPAFHSSNSPIQLTIIPSSAERDWRHIVERELSTGFPTGEGPLMRANVLHDRHGASIVLTFHHAANDGLSGANIIGDLMKALVGRTLDPLPLRLSLEDALDQALGQDTQMRSLVEEIDIDAVRAVARAPLWRPFEGDRPRVSAVMLDRARTKRLAECCRKNGTTVHGAVSAALVSCMDLPQARLSVRILNPINVRSVLNLPAGESGLYVGVGVTNLSRETASFWERAREAVGHLDAFRSPESIWLGAKRLQKYLPPGADDDVACGLVGAVGYDAVITNLGVVPLDETVGGLRLAAFWGPSVQGRFHNDVTIGVATHGGILRIIQTSPPETTVLTENIAACLVEACR